MLNKQERIPRALFDTILKKGASFHSPLLSVSILAQDKALQPSKFSVVISKKVAKFAVERNKLRRRAYSVFSKNKQDIKKGQHAILFFKKGSNKLSFLETEKEIKNILHKANLYEKNSS